MRSVVSKFQTITNAPVLVAQKANVVKSAHFVTEFLNRETAQEFSPHGALGSKRIGNETAGMEGDQAFMPTDDGEALWTEALPDIVLVEEDGTTVHASHDLQDYRAEYACRYVLEHYSENINRDKMAERVNLSPGYFSNLFRSEVGMSFSDYLIQVRIDNAKCLLRRFDLSVDAISKKCGFNSLAHFSRTFKDRCGRSPLKYRKSPNVVA